MIIINARYIKAAISVLFYKPKNETLIFCHYHFWINNMLQPKWFETRNHGGHDARLAECRGGAHAWQGQETGPQS